MQAKQYIVRTVLATYDTYTASGVHVVADRVADWNGESWDVWVPGYGFCDRFLSTAVGAVMPNIHSKTGSFDGRQLETLSREAFAALGRDDAERTRILSMLERY